MNLKKSSKIIAALFMTINLSKKLLRSVHVTKKDEIIDKNGAIENFS